MARKELAILNAGDLRNELAREEAKYRLRKTLLNIAGILMVIAAITTLVATRVLNLFQVNGSSMAPTLAEGDFVVLLQTKKVEPGDIIGFHYGGEVLLKRIIGSGGDLIEIDEDGTVSVNGRTADHKDVCRERDAALPQGRVRLFFRIELLRLSEYGTIYKTGNCQRRELFYEEKTNGMVPCRSVRTAAYRMRQLYESRQSPLSGRLL